MDPNDINVALNRLPKANTDKVMTNTINYLLYSAGVLAVIMIVLSGIKMTTSAGNPQAVTRAKATMLYAIVGLVVVVLAYAMVNFVVGRVA